MINLTSAIEPDQKIYQTKYHDIYLLKRYGEHTICISHCVSRKKCSIGEGHGLMPIECLYPSSELNRENRIKYKWSSGKMWFFQCTLLVVLSREGVSLEHVAHVLSSRALH
ncbi:rCG22246 [Rattus norvegicus]|uniref:RCG22246 n=1 Tax=Rattus norvegicus TaxID=10116 RepID=A6INW4_RAT|nr:rCG22246 [Rattus norvegicus]